MNFDFEISKVDCNAKFYQIKISAQYSNANFMQCDQKRARGKWLLYSIKHMQPIKPILVLD